MHTSIFQGMPRGSCNKVRKLKFFGVVLNYILGKVRKNQIDSMNTLEVIAKKPQGGGRLVPPPLWGIGLNITDKHLFAET